MNRKTLTCPAGPEKESGNRRGKERVPIIPTGTHDKRVTTLNGYRNNIKI